MSAVGEHLRAQLGAPAESHTLRTAVGDIRMHSYRDTPDPGVRTCITDGLWKIPAAHDQQFGQELLVSWHNANSDAVRDDWAAFLNILTNEGHPLKTGELLELTRPFAGTTRMSSFLVDVPHYFDERLWELSSAGRSIRILWLIPLHDGEVRLMIGEGYRGLSTLFGDAEELDLTDLARQSLA